MSNYLTTCFRGAEDGPCIRDFILLLASLEDVNMALAECVMYLRRDIRSSDTKSVRKSETK